MADSTITVEMRLVPSEESLAACLCLLNLWQEENPDKMVAMVPDKDRYRYEIILRENVQHGE